MISRVASNLETPTLTVRTALGGFGAWTSKILSRRGSDANASSAASRNASAPTKGAPVVQSEGVNYRMLVLGCEGYIARTLVTDKAQVDSQRPVTATLLEKMTFNSGMQYADFNSNTDRVAEFGLAALVAGVAAIKLGLLALGAALAVKIRKLIVLAVAGAFLAFRKKLGFRTKKEQAPVLGANPPQSACVTPTDVSIQEPKV